MGEQQMTPSEQFLAKRWFIVGAYQSGATDKVISNMVGLSSASVHNVITQFKRTGSPVRKRLHLNEKATGYDDLGRIIDSDDELGENEYNEIRPKKTRPKRPSAKDVINYVLHKAQQHQQHQQQHAEERTIMAEEEKISIKQEEEDDKQEMMLYQNKWRPPTPPYHHSQQKGQSFDNSNTALLSPPLTEHKQAEWTMEEDKILMAHVLTRLTSERWPEAVAKLKGRHDIVDCQQRWELLKELLLKGADKSGTRGW
ncbi:hypothetical protein RMCBS344292_19070 [Rhizopus microsporus]|nr:hypothetical protein RMCBS344292_19070 [Rhizopus microsporus]